MLPELVCCRVSRNVDCWPIDTMPMTLEEPHLVPILELDCRAIFTMLLTVAEPVLVPENIEHRRPVFTMKHVIDEVLLGT